MAAEAQRPGIDREALTRSRFRYVLLQPLERIDSPSVKAPQSQPTTESTTTTQVSPTTMPTTTP